MTRSQSDNNLHVAQDDNSIIMPCLAGCYDEHVTITFDPWDSNPSFGYFTVQYGYDRWQPRDLWRIFRGKKSWSEVELSLDTAKALRDWLDKKIAEAERPINPEQQATW